MTTVQINAAPKRLTDLQFKMLAGTRMMESLIKNCAVVIDADDRRIPKQALWDAGFAVHEWLSENCTTHYFIEHLNFDDKKLTADTRTIERVYFLSARDMVHFKLVMNGKKIA